MIDLWQKKDVQNICEYVIGIKPINVVFDESFNSRNALAIEFKDSSNECVRQAVRVPIGATPEKVISILCEWSLVALGMGDKNAEALANERIAEFCAAHGRQLATAGNGSGGENGGA